MSDFNYSDYTDALVNNGSYRFAPEDANRDEYRAGLQKTAKGLIKAFDDNNDGHMNEDEFIKKEKSEHTRLEHTVDDAFGLTDKERADLKKKYKYNGVRTREVFKAMDLNGDGKLSTSEVANVILLCDANDSPDNEADGAIGTTGLGRVFSDKKSPETIRKALVQNYKDQNMAKLGKKGDIERTNIRRDIGSVVDVANQQGMNDLLLQTILQNNFGSSQNINNIQNGNIINNFQKIIHDILNLILQLLGINSVNHANRTSSGNGGKYYC